MVTADQLQAIMPRITPARKAACLPFLHAAMTEFAIDRPARAAALLAQLAHESGQFRFMEEIWGPTDAQKRYEPPGTLADRLGNSQAGDGRRFKGRGPIQITGRANYARFGALLGIDLLADPARAAAPEVAFRIAALFWSKKGLNELADVATDDAFKEITRRINGGFNGLDDRRQFYAAARRVLGVSDAPLTRSRGGARPAPDATDEPVFERGAEAIRTRTRRTPARKAALKTRKTKARKTKARKRNVRRPPTITATRRKTTVRKISRRKR
jgi:predicted chitinase